MENTENKIKNNIYYLKYVNKFIDLLIKENVSVLMVVDEISYLFKEKLNQAKIAYFEVI